MLKIFQAGTAEQIATVRELMLEYATWLDFDLCFQGFEDEMRTLPGKYGPPDGRLLLADWDDRPAGMVALRPQEQAGLCEMKRLYVRTAFRGHSIGRVLAEQVITKAAALGYERMRLDTVAGTMDRAIAVYRSLGFQKVGPYYDSPVSKTIFMELVLHGSQGGVRGS